MSSDLVGLTLVKELAIRSVGRDPAWVVHPSLTAAPDEVSDGVSVEDAVVCLLAVGLRRNSHVHASRVKVETADLTTTTYTITVDGNAVNYDASVELPANQDELVNDLRDAVNNDATVGAIVTARSTDSDGDGVLDTIVLENDGGEAATHTTAVSTSGGTGVLSFGEDSTAASFRVWLLPDQQNDPDATPKLSWLLINGADFTIDRRGFLERLETAGALRLAVEVYSITSPSGSNAEANVQVGPGVLES